MSGAERHRLAGAAQILHQASFIDRSWPQRATGHCVYPAEGHIGVISERQAEWPGGSRNWTSLRGDTVWVLPKRPRCN